MEAHLRETEKPKIEARIASAVQRAQEEVVKRWRAESSRRRQQEGVVYTMPPRPRAGDMVSVFYNPQRTMLQGRPEVYVRGSFNRWRHPSCFIPTRMTPAWQDAEFLTCTLQLPDDAHSLELTFADSAEGRGGFLDDNGGLDYHIPTTGATGQPPRLHVVHVAVEMAPVAKVGGLGDVVTALGRATVHGGHRVNVIMPKYDVLKYEFIENLRYVGEFYHNGTLVRPPWTFPRGLCGHVCPWVPPPHGWLVFTREDGICGTGQGASGNGGGPGDVLFGAVERAGQRRLCLRPRR